jgi:hypothetical protein
LVGGKSTDIIIQVWFINTGVTEVERFSEVKQILIMQEGWWAI